MRISELVEGELYKFQTKYCGGVVPAYRCDELCVHDYDRDIGYSRMIISNTDRDVREMLKCRNLIMLYTGAYTNVEKLRKVGSDHAVAAIPIGFIYSLPFYEYGQHGEPSFTYWLIGTKAYWISDAALLPNIEPLRTSILY